MLQGIKRRLLGAALLTALFLTLIPVPAHAARFSDISKGAWYYSTVTDLAQKGIVAGYPDGLFRPHTAASAGMAVLTVMRAAGCGALDSSGRHWAAAYRDYAVARGFVQWESVADLDAPMSRGDIAKVAARALGLESLEGPSPFADTDDGCYAALYDMGIVAGMVDEAGVRRFHPDQAVTRAELCSIVWQTRRAYEHGRQIYFEGGYLDVLEGVPVNTYDPRWFKSDGGRMRCAGGGLRSAQGIDVSAYQREIDWKKVAADGIEFAILRVGGRGYTRGSIYDDVYFDANIQGALAAGLDVGVYFFSQAVTVREAEEEARYVLRRIRGYDLTYPVVFDWENISQDAARTDGLDADTLCAAANAFCGMVARAGYQPMIYFNAYIGYRCYDLSQVARWPFWLAQYSAQPDFYYGFELWQYTSSGRVDGIEGPVDMDIRIFR